MLQPRRGRVEILLFFAASRPVVDSEYRLNPAIKWSGEKQDKTPSANNLLTYLLTYLHAYILHGAESYLRS